MEKIIKSLLAIICLMIGTIAFPQQLKLGKSPYMIEKSAVLELQSDNQGLLLSRITDTSLVNSLNPSDGMVIFHVPSKRLLLRMNGYWAPLVPSASLSDFWSVNGNSNGAIKKLGNMNGYDLPFITNNIERMRILANGYIGIGTSTPSTMLHIRSGTSGDSGLRLENLTSASPTTAGAAMLGVDATGKVVRTKTPVYYSGTGTTASMDEVTKIWVAEVVNNTSGVVTVTLPTNIGFTNILNIQVSAKSGSSTAAIPIASVTSNTNTSITIRVLQIKSATPGYSGVLVEGSEDETNPTTRIYIRVEGN